VAEHLRECYITENNSWHHYLHWKFWLNRICSNLSSCSRFRKLEIQQKLNLYTLKVIVEKLWGKLTALILRHLRRIFGPTKENQIWRIKTNEELDKLIKLKNIVNCIKAQRLSWFGHVQRMSDTRTIKKIFKWKPLTKRSQGRPKYRWEDNTKQDICQMKIKNWIACVQDRGKWKDVVEVKIFHH